MQDRSAMSMAEPARPGPVWVGNRILERPQLAPGERLVPVAELSGLLVNLRSSAANRR